MKNKEFIFLNLQSISRMIIALIFILISFDKLMNLDVLYTIASFKDIQVSKHFTIITFPLLELVLGIYLLIGYKIRPVSLMLAFLVAILTIFMHDFWSMSNHEMNFNLHIFMKNLMIFSGLIYIGSSPADKLSLDKSYETLKKNNKRRKSK